MTNQYRAITWTPHKLRYDLFMVIGIACYLILFVLIGRLVQGDRGFDATVTSIRAMGTCAFVLLHIILSIGPLARLNPKWLPLLYNRRHLGVTTCLMAIVHAVLVTMYYHGGSKMNPLVSLLVNTTRTGVGFEVYGIGALLILLLLAVTSHDFWLHALGSCAWKWLHMLVYVAYVLLVAHVALGVLQDQNGWLMSSLLFAGIAIVSSLHIAAGLHEVRADRMMVGSSSEDGGWIQAGAADSYVDGQAKIVRCPHGERIAVYRHNGSLRAVTNVCAHQGGPLGEGRIIDGCITCPWHGYQYYPQNGQSPPPYSEKIATYDVKIERGTVLVRCTANAPGTSTVPVALPTVTSPSDDALKAQTGSVAP